MIKGVYKNTVIIKSPDGIIEEAIFILKPSAVKKEDIDRETVIREITRLLRDNTHVGGKNRDKSLSLTLKKPRR